jgi:hypothetical protein
MRGFTTSRRGFDILDNVLPAGVTVGLTIPTDDAGSEAGGAKLGSHLNRTKLGSHLNRTKKPRLTTGLQLVFTSGKESSRQAPLPPSGTIETSFWSFGSRTYVAKLRYLCKMASVVYRCPTTGKNVQPSFDDDDTPPDDSLTYVSLRCPACARLHLVNRTGRTIQPPVINQTRAS